MLFEGHYYLGTSNQPSIVYTGVYADAVSIGNVSVNEGSTTTTANFLVTLSAPAATLADHQIDI